MGFNYRKFYFEQVGKKYSSKTFDIHHINLNREDNRIDNLVALPKKLHHQYHFYKSLKDDTAGYDVDHIGSSREEQYYKFYREKTLDIHQKFYSVIQECTKWVDERNELLREKGADFLDYRTAEGI